MWQLLHKHALALQMGLSLRKERRRSDLADRLKSLTRNTQAKRLDPRAAHQLWILCCSRWAWQIACEVAQWGFYRASVSVNRMQSSEACSSFLLPGDKGMAM